MDDTGRNDLGQRPTRRLKVDLVDLAAAFDAASWEMSYFLDLETGQVILITDDTRSLYNRLVETIGDMDQAEWTMAFESMLKDSDLPDWQQEAVREADQVEAGFGERYLRVPQAEPREGYADMEAFIETVTQKGLAERLWRAIEGRGAFRRFKDVLSEAPAERQRWFVLRDARQRQRVLAWLESEGAEPLDRDPV